MKLPKLKLIRDERDYEQALAAVEKLWDATPESPAHDALGVLALLIEDYERRNFPLEDPDPVEAIRFRLEQLGREPSSLSEIIGSRGRVSEILNGRRKLSLRMIRKLHDELHIPFEALIPARP
jgi:HTH-type transcriptional regulator/antitoxin HigA